MTDFYVRFFRPNVSSSEQMRVLYIASFCWGILGILCALAMIQAKGILDAYWVLAGIFSGGIVGIFLLGFCSRKANGRGALLGMLIGMLVVLWMTAAAFHFWPSFLEKYESPFHNYMINVLGTITVFLIGFIASLLLPQRRKEH